MKKEWIIIILVIISMISFFFYTIEQERKIKRQQEFLNRILKYNLTPSDLIPYNFDDYQ